MNFCGNTNERTSLMRYQKSLSWTNWVKAAMWVMHCCTGRWCPLWTFYTICFGSTSNKPLTLLWSLMPWISLTKFLAVLENCSHHFSIQKCLNFLGLFRDPLFFHQCFHELDPCPCLDKKICPPLPSSTENKTNEKTDQTWAHSLSFVNIIQLFGTYGAQNLW